jgi:hypothetical protein
MESKAALTLLLALTVTAGCARVTRTYLADDVFVQPDSDDKPYFTEEGERIDLSKINVTDYDSDPEKRRALISDMVALSDKKCTWHKATVMANSNVWNIATGTATILFAGAASVVEHAQTAAELAAGAAGTSGIRSLANQEIYADALVTTILRAIDVRREKKLAPISEGLASADYRVADAVRDVQAYHDACSLMGGLLEVTKAFENRKRSQGEIRRDIAELEAGLSDDKRSLLGDEQIKKLQERLLELRLDLTEAGD